MPDPVFVPQQATNAAAGHRAGQRAAAGSGRLAVRRRGDRVPRARPADRAGRINGQNATVDLGGKHGQPRTAAQQLEQMAAQLAWTLGSGPTAIQSVELEINGRPVPIAGSQYQLPQTYHGLGADSAGRIQPVLRRQQRSGPGAVRRRPARRRAARSGQPVPGAAGTAGAPPFTSIAVSPDRRSVAGIAAGGAAVYIGSLSHGAALREWRPTERQLHLGELGRAGRSLDRRRRHGLDAAAGRRLARPWSPWPCRPGPR